MKLGTTILFLATATASSEDWPCWRGPHADGVARDDSWTDSGRELWRSNVGLGHSAISVADGRLYTLGFHPDDGVDRLVCLEAATGAELWAREYPGRLRDQNHTGGTLTTPAVAQGKVFVASREGALRCYDAESGELHWDQDVAAQVETDPGLYGFGGSPLVYADLVILELDRVVAVDAATGELRWSTEPIEAQYSTPAVFEIGGEPRLAVFTEAALEVLDPVDGSALFRHPWRPQRRGVNASTPVVAGERIFVSSAYERGCALVAFDGGEARAVWANKRMRNKMAGCVRVGELIFGFDESMLKCLDLAGEERWRVRGLGNGAVSAAGSRLLLTSSRGELVVARAAASEFTELSRKKLFEEGTLWTPPTIAKGRVYVRSGLGELVCLDHRPETARAAAATEGTPAGAELPEATALFERHLALVGGAEAVRAVTGLRVTGTFEMRSVGFMPVPFTLERRAPNLYHAEIGLPAPIEGSLHRIFDGEVAFELNEYLGDELYDEDVCREYSDSSDIADAANFASNYESLETVARVEFADRPCWRVAAVTKNGAQRSVYFSVETGYLVGREGPTESVAIFDAYAEFGAVRLPTHERWFQQGTGIEEVWRVQAVEFVDVDPGAFERPASIQELLDERDKAE